MLRSAKKSYFKRLLEKKRNDIDGTWKILKQVTGTSHAGNHYHDHLGNNGVRASNKKDIANMFNNLFTNIGSKLSIDIILPANVTIYDYLKHKNNHKLFLMSVSEEEVIECVRLWASNTSTDYEDISMKLIKQVIDFVAKPVTHICNLSLSMGIFAEKKIK